MAIVSDYDWPTGGIEQFVVELIRGAAETYECRLITWNANPPVPNEFDGRRILEHGDAGALWTELDAAAAIVVMASFNVRMLARVAAEYLTENTKTSITVVHTSGHSSPSSPAVATQMRWLYELGHACTYIVAVSEEVGSALESLDRFPKEKVVVIENAARLRGSPRIAMRRNNISFIGRPHPQKGFALFERLASELSGGDLNFQANTVSVPPGKYSPHIRYSCRLKDDELADFFAGTDLLVVPYIHADGQPLAILEALSCGVPIIGFDVPGVGSLLRQYGQAVVEPTYASLARAVQDWITGELWIEPPRPERVPSWDAQIRRYLELLSAKT